MELQTISQVSKIFEKNMLEKVLDNETLLHTISAIADINKSFNEKKIEMEDLRMANNVLDTLKRLFKKRVIINLQ